MIKGEGTADLKLRGRVALVTGGSRGIGRAVAGELAQQGVKVAVNYASAEASAREVVELAASSGVKAISVRGDVSRTAEAEEVVCRTVEELGGLDILICNAGIWEGARVEEHTEQLWERLLETNLKGTWAVCRAATPFLKEGGWGRIVIVSSTAGQRGEAFYSGYAASKGGQIALTKSLAAELAPFNVTVNAVAPGWVQTEMTAAVLADAEACAEILRAIPLGRVASPEDVALPILFLCSDWARHITGEVLNVNGGSVLCG